MHMAYITINGTNNIGIKIQLSEYSLMYALAHGLSLFCSYCSQQAIYNWIWVLFYSVFPLNLWHTCCSPSNNDAVWQRQINSELWICSCTACSQAIKARGLDCCTWKASKPPFKFCHNPKPHLVHMKHRFNNFSEVLFHRLYKLIERINWCNKATTKGISIALL